MGPEQRLLALTVLQHGVFARRQAIAVGFSPSCIRRRVQAGRWVSVHRGVYRVAGAPASWHQMVMAAVLAGGPGAMASHRSAGVLWALEGLGEWLPEISVPENRHIVRPGIVIHRSRELKRDRRKSRGIPVTAVSRTLIDLAAVLDGDRLEACLDDALRRRVVALSRLRDRLAELNPRRPGLRVLRELVVERDPRAPVAGSGLEAEFLRILRGGGLPEPARQVLIRVDGKTYRVDFAYPDKEIAIEVDGYAYHASRTRWEADLERQNALIRSGMTVLRFGATHVRRRPEHISRTVRVCLQALA